jgi:hypothetical protein
LAGRSRGGAERAVHTRAAERSGACEKRRRGLLRSCRSVERALLKTWPPPADPIEKGIPRAFHEPLFGMAARSCCVSSPLCIMCPAENTVVTRQIRDKYEYSSRRPLRSLLTIPPRVGRHAVLPRRGRRLAGLPRLLVSPPRLFVAPAPAVHAEAHVPPHRHRQPRYQRSANLRSFPRRRRRKRPQQPRPRTRRHPWPNLTTDEHYAPPREQHQLRGPAYGRLRVPSGERTIDSIRGLKGGGTLQKRKRCLLLLS